MGEGEREMNTEPRLEGLILAQMLQWTTGIMGYELDFVDTMNSWSGSILHTLLLLLTAYLL